MLLYVTIKVSGTVHGEALSQVTKVPPQTGVRNEALTVTEAPHLGEHNPPIRGQHQKKFVTSGTKNHN